MLQLNSLDAVGLTLAAIRREEHYHAQEMNDLRAFIEKQSKAA